MSLAIWGYNEIHKGLLFGNYIYCSYRNKGHQTRPSWQLCLFPQEQLICMLPAPKTGRQIPHLLLGELFSPQAPCLEPQDLNCYDSQLETNDKRRRWGHFLWLLHWNVPPECVSGSYASWSHPSMAYALFMSSTLLCITSHHRAPMPLTHQEGGNGAPLAFSDPGYTAA